MQGKKNCSTIRKFQIDHRPRLPPDPEEYAHQPEKVFIQRIYRDLERLAGEAPRPA